MAAAQESMDLDQTDPARQPSTSTASHKKRFEVKKVKYYI